MLLSAKAIRVPEAVAATRKLSKRAYGPFSVVEVLSPVTYRLDLPKHFKLHPVFHISRLQPFYEASAEFPDRQQVYSPPPPEVIGTEDYFKVEAFVDERGSGRRKEYKVHWVGYGPEHRTWEKASALQGDMQPEDFKAFVRAFEERKRHKRQPAGRR